MILAFRLIFGLEKSYPEIKAEKNYIIRRID